MTDYTTILLPHRGMRLSGACATRKVRAASFEDAARQREIGEGLTLLVTDGDFTKAYTLGGLKEV